MSENFIMPSVQSDPSALLLRRALFSLEPNHRFVTSRVSAPLSSILALCRGPLILVATEKSHDV